MVFWGWLPPAMGISIDQPAERIHSGKWLSFPDNMAFPEVRPRIILMSGADWAPDGIRYGGQEWWMLVAPPLGKPNASVRRPHDQPCQTFQKQTQKSGIVEVVATQPWVIPPLGHKGTIGPLDIQGLESSKHRAHTVHTAVLRKHADTQADCKCELTLVVLTIFGCCSLMSSLLIISHAFLCRKSVIFWCTCHG